MRLLPALVIGLGLAPAAFAEGVAIVVDKVVAFVGTRPITLSEVELELRLQRAADGDGDAALGPVSKAELAGLLPDLVARTALLRGMRAGGDKVHPETIEKELARMREAFSSRAEWERFLRRLELSEEEVRERRRRVLEAESLLASEVETAAQVRSQEVDEYLARNPGLDRAEAERRLRTDRELEVRQQVLEKRRRDTQARIVDLILPGATTAAPEPDGEP